MLSRQRRSEPADCAGTEEGDPPRIRRVFRKLVNRGMDRGGCNRAPPRFQMQNAGPADSPGTQGKRVRRLATDTYTG